MCVGRGQGEVRESTVRVPDVSEGVGKIPSRTCDGNSMSEG